MQKLLKAGVDEVGRGCLAGPVVSAAVILKEGINLDLLKDSKKISASKRLILSKIIKRIASVGLGIVMPNIIDKIGISKATNLAAQKSLPNNVNIKKNLIDDFKNDFFILIIICISFGSLLRLFVYYLVLLMAHICCDSSIIWD